MKDEEYRAAVAWGMSETGGMMTTKAGESHESGGAFDQWAIVDVMGHQRFVGRVTEQVIAGQGFVRIDVPQTESQPAWTKLVGTGSIYAITPVSEEIARGLAEQSQTRPVQAYELPKVLTRPSAMQPDLDEEYY